MHHRATIRVQIRLIHIVNFLGYDMHPRCANMRRTAPQRVRMFAQAVELSGIDRLVERLHDCFGIGQEVRDNTFNKFNVTQFPQILDGLGIDRRVRNDA